MTRRVFCSSVDSISDYSKHNEKKGALRNGFVEPEVRVAISLRTTAGASDLELICLWHVARQTIYHVFNEIANTIVRIHKMDGFPETESGYASLAQGFSNQRRKANPLRRCITSLNRIAICIAKPIPSDCKNLASDYRRKGYYSLPFKK